MNEAMKYSMGTPIPPEEVLRRFKDEDGEIFIEVRGLDDVLFRVTGGDRVYYKIEKSKMKGEDLTLVEDNSLVRPKPKPSRETLTAPTTPTAPTPKPQALLKNAEIDLRTWWSSTEEPPQPEKKPKKPEELVEFDEGQIIPEDFRSDCTRNDYGGYTLRFKKYLYLLDSHYQVEIKSPDTESRYAQVMESAEFDSSDEIVTLTDPLSDTGTDYPTPAKNQAEIELKMGEILPLHLRVQCESQIGGYGYGSRITLGNYLYMLDFSFRVIQKMKISIFDEEEKKGFPPIPTPAMDTTANPGELSPKDRIFYLIKFFETALSTYNINGDYFKETVLGPANQAILLRAYHGDLTDLNDDTREAARQGKLVKLPGREGGLNLLKAVFIHELYINSTVRGRGENMKYLITHFDTAQTEKEGELEEDFPAKEQKKILEFFKNQAFIYDDKTEIIRWIHLQIRTSILIEYEELRSKKEKVRFKALLICKLYEHTTRLDRGDGITMIRLTRDLLDYPNNK